MIKHIYIYITGFLGVNTMNTVGSVVKYLTRFLLECLPKVFEGFNDISRYKKSHLLSRK